MVELEVPPHGGRLIDRVLRGDAQEDARARASPLKRIALNARMMSDLELLAVGASSRVAVAGRVEHNARAVAY